MIHWPWLIVAFYAGMAVAIVSIAFCNAASCADKQTERRPQ
jgi:hypothetical protein